MAKATEMQPFNVFWSLLPSPEPAWQFHCNSGSNLPLLVNREHLDSIADAILTHPSQEIRVTFTGFQPAWHPGINALVSKLAHGGRKISIVVEADLRITLSSLLELMHSADMQEAGFNLYINPETDSLTGVYSHIRKLCENGIPLRVFLLDGPVSRKTQFFKSLQTLQRSTDFKLCETAETISDYFSGERRQSANLVNEGEGFLCLAGTRFLRIDAAGAAYSAPCQCKPFARSAWMEKTFWGGHFNKCGMADCPADGVWGLCRFGDPAQARAHFLELQAADLSSYPDKGSSLSATPAGSGSGCQISPPDAGVPGTLAAFAALLEEKGKSAEISPEEIRDLYQVWRRPVLEELADAYVTRKLNMACDANVLASMAHVPALTELLLDECVQVYRTRHMAEREIPRRPLQNGADEKAAIYCQKKASSGHVPFFSVIFCNRNGGSLIKNTLDSILGQDFGSFEIMAIDDSSSDNSMEILREYAKNDARISLWSSNRPLFEGRIRNALLNYASGKYICYSNSGDTVARSFFRAAARSLAAADFDVAIFNCGASGKGLLADNPHNAGSNMGRSDAIARFLKNEIDSSLVGKIFNKIHLQSACRGFGRHASCPDDDFLLSALLGAKNILASSFHGGTSVGPRMSFAENIASDIPDSELYGFQIHFAKAARLFLGTDLEAAGLLPETAIRNLERAVLPALLWRKESGEPMFQPDAGRQALASSPLFIYSLLGYLGRMKAELRANTREG